MENPMSKTGLFLLCLVAVLTLQSCKNDDANSDYYFAIFYKTYALSTEHTGAFINKDGELYLYNDVNLVSGSLSTDGDYTRLRLDKMYLTNMHI